MNLTTRIAFRHLRSKHNFGFITFSTFLSIIGLMIGIASLIIISCISDGFSNVINFKLSGIDGHIRVNSYLNEEMSESKIEEIDSILYCIMEKKFSKEQTINQTHIESSIVEKIYQLYKNSEHKRITAKIL